MSGTAVEVSVYVAARPEEAFRYFTDPDHYVQWMGSKAELEPVPGGRYRVHMSDGFRAAGTFVALDAPRQLAFTWGFADDEAASHVKHEPSPAGGGSAMPAGSTRVTVTFDAEGDGTRLTLRHDNLPSAQLRDAHQIAWQTYLPRLTIRAAGGDPGPDPHA